MNRLDKIGARTVAAMLALLVVLAFCAASPTDDDMRRCMERGYSFGQCHKMNHG